MNPDHRISASLLSRLSSIPSSGIASIQNQIDSLTSGFLEQSTDEKTLASVAAGGLAYRLGKIGVITLGVGRVSALPLRVFSTAFGLGTEVTGFEFTNRLLHTIRSIGQSPLPTGSNLWKWNGQAGWKQGLLSSAATFGLLKGAGHLAQGQNIILQHLFQDAAMVTGHQALGAFGVSPKPEGTIVEQFVHAQTTILQMQAGMGWVQGIFPGFMAFERELDLSLRSERTDLPRTKTFFNFLIPPFELAIAASANDSVEMPPLKESGEKPLLLTMSANEGNRPGLAKMRRFWSRWFSKKQAEDSPEKIKTHLDRIGTIKNRNLQEKGPYRPERGVTPMEVFELKRYSQSADPVLRFTAQETMRTLSVTELNTAPEEMEELEAFCHLAELGNLAAAKILLDTAKSNLRIFDLLKQMTPQHPGALKIFNAVLAGKGETQLPKINKIGEPMFPEWVRGALQKILAKVVEAKDRDVSLDWDTKASFYAALGYTQKLLGRPQEAHHFFELAKESVDEQVDERPQAYGAHYGDAYEEIEVFRNGRWPEFSSSFEPIITNRIWEPLSRKDWSAAFHFVEFYPDIYRQSLGLAYLTKELSASVDSLIADWESQGNQEFPRLLVKGDPLPTSGEIWEVQHIDFEEDRIVLTHGKEILSGGRFKPIEGDRRVTVPQAFGWIFNPGDRVVLSPVCPCCM